MKQAAKRVTGLLAACALLVALVPGTIWAAGSESETGPGTSINEIQSDSLPTGTEGGADSENSPEGAPSGGDGEPITVPEPAEPEEPAAEMPGAPTEDGDGLLGDAPEPGGDAPEREPEESEPEDDTDNDPEDDPAPLVRPSNRLIMPTALTNDLAVGTWAGTDSKPGNGHRWVEFGGIVWRVLEVTVSDGNDGNDAGNKTAFLLAEDLIGTQEFHGTANMGDGYWVDSDLREWLNEDFLNNTLGGVKDAILNTTYTLGGTYDYENDYGYSHATRDESKVFLLSVDEAENLEYFANNGDRVAYLSDNSDGWWLRSPGSNAGTAALVYLDGAVDPHGPYVDINYGLRPALKINLASDIFSSSDLRYTTTVRIMDENDVAIPNAEVTISGASAPDAKFTNYSGEASWFLAAGNYTVTVQKFGYEIYSDTITVSASGVIPIALNENCALLGSVQFGRDNTSTPLNWQVLHVDDEASPPRAVLLADSQLMQDTWPNITSWITDNGNNGFLEPDGYFTQAELDAMLEHETEDTKMFLLSLDEVEKYMPYGEMRAFTNGAGSFWWLRSAYANNIYRVVNNGTGSSGSAHPSNNNNDARPAVWVDLTKLYQHEDEGGNVTLVPLDSYAAEITVQSGGNPVNGAAITVTPSRIDTAPGAGEALRTWDGIDVTTGPYTGQADATGKAAFALLPGDYTVTASAPGYENATTTFTVSTGTVTETLTLGYTAPAVSITPADNAPDVPVKASIVLTFNKEMEPGAGSVTLNGTPQTGAWSVDNTVYTIAYTGLAYDTQYTIAVSGFEDLADEAITPVTSTFTTATKTDVSGDIAFEDGSDTYTGSDLTHETATVSGFTPSGTPAWTYTYTTSNGSLDGGGKPVGAGTYTVTAEYEDDDHMGSATATFTVNPASISGADVQVGGSYTYTGAAQTPASTDVTVTLDGNTLAATNYTYAASNHTNAGEATVTVTGTGNYTGTASREYTIEKADLSIASATIAPKTYNGSASVAVTAAALTGMVNNETLTFGTDFTATATFDNANAGDSKTVTMEVTLNTTGAAANYTVAGSYDLTGQKILKAAATGVNQQYPVPVNHLFTHEYDLSALLPSIGQNEQFGNITYSYVNHTDTDGILTGTPTVTGDKLEIPADNVAEPGKTATITIRIESNNFTISDATITVKTEAAAAVAIDGITVASKVYDGQPFAYTGTLQSRENGAQVGVQFTERYTGTGGYSSATPPTNAGDYVLTVNAAAPGYTGERVYTFSISPKTVVVRVADMEIQQGAALPDARVTYTGFVGSDNAGNTLDTVAKAKMPVSDSSKAGTWTVGFETEAVLNNTTGTNYTLEHKPGTLTITEKPTEPTKPTEPDKQPNPISFESLPEHNTVRVGESFRLVPTEDGQTGSDGWKWDSDFFSATFNSPATFTALKAGTSTITYTAPDGRVASVTITIQAASDSGTGGSAITATGDSSRVGVYAAIAALAAGGILAAYLFKRRQRKNT